MREKIKHWMCAWPIIGVGHSYNPERPDWMIGPYFDKHFNKYPPAQCLHCGMDHPDA